MTKSLPLLAIVIRAAIDRVEPDRSSRCYLSCTFSSTAYRRCHFLHKQFSSLRPIAAKHLLTQAPDLQTASLSVALDSFRFRVSKSYGSTIAPRPVLCILTARKVSLNLMNLNFGNSWSSINIVRRPTASAPRPLMAALPGRASLEVAFRAGISIA
jgi:hypothetical protein